MAEPQVLPPGDQEKRRRRLRNWAILLALGAFVIIVYVVALVKMGYFS